MERNQLNVSHRRGSLLVLIASLALISQSVQADSVRAAVAANFTAARKEITTDFEKASGHRVIPSFGSTGKLYTQIVNGAPFHVLLAADQRRPQRLAAQHIASDRFTYAIGKLVLWSSKTDSRVGPASLRADNFGKLAIANPKTAPYGAAAVEVLNNLGLYATLRPKLITADSIAQAYQFAATGNAGLGFVALAQIALDDSGSRWVVDESLYTPIRQDAVLLDKGKDNPAAQALLDYLRSEAARRVMRKYGYGSE
jgi:molybdate transport system substrate-binding protein